MRWERSGRKEEKRLMKLDRKERRDIYIYNTEGNVGKREKDEAKMNEGGRVREKKKKKRKGMEVKGRGEN